MSKHFVYIVMDSCRYDSFARANTPNIDRLGKAERRYSFASWTSPSHQTLLMGQVPHTSPQEVFASEVYKDEFMKWVDRLGIPNLSFKKFVPDLSLPKVLKDHGYKTTARMSMPVLNPLAGFNRFFDDYKLMEDHNDFAGMVKEMRFDPRFPCFYFCNLGETHYPYMLKDNELPRISGVHGVFKGMDDAALRGGDKLDTADEFFSMDMMRELHDQQVRTIEYVDGIVGELFQKAAPDTHFIITADHGELFGEEGYFGHGPIMHEKVFEVPFIEGTRPPKL
ncbi:MAG: sulfatase-like hydrolase/transferase [Pseudomonadota bacterium]